MFTMERWPGRKALWRAGRAVGISGWLALTGCGSEISPSAAAVTSVVPSAAGIPISVASLGSFEFVAVQQTGQIFTYNLDSGAQVQAVPAYVTPCQYPSGMVATTISGIGVLAVVCYDTGTLLTMTIHADGSLAALGSVSGLPNPYPGIALDGTNVLVPLFGVSLVANGAVAKVDISVPLRPVVSGITPIASGASGGFSNPGFLAVSGGMIYVAAGSESGPLDTSSTIQVVNEATMTLVGAPLVVAHSPQQIAVHGQVAYVAFFDATEVESVDVSNPANLKPLQVLSLAKQPACHALPIVLRDTVAYVGCYAEGTIERMDVSQPGNMVPLAVIPNVKNPQDMRVDGHSLLVVGASNGGSVYQIEIGGSN